LIRGFDMEVLLGVVAELLDSCLIKNLPLTSWLG